MTRGDKRACKSIHRLDLVAVGQAPVAEAFFQLEIYRITATFLFLELLDLFVELFATLAPAVGRVLLADHEREARVTAQAFVCEIVPSVGAEALRWMAAKRSGIFGPM